MDTENKLSAFYSNIVHEFRTPLTLILSPAQQILNDSQDDEAKLNAEIIRNNANKLLKLINEMLDISKLENKSMILQEDQGDIVLFIQQLLNTFKAFISHKKISLLFYSDFKSLPILFDKDKFEKVLSNLVSNASKFTKTGGKVTVQLSLINEKLLHLVVTDSGIGITKEKLPFVFDRFYQGDTRRFVDQDGTGIGLSLCKELTTLMGGEISAKSVVDKGSEFTLKIPIKLATAAISYEKTIQNFNEKNQKITNHDDVSLSENDSLLPMLLLVDDNDDLRSYLINFFQKSYHVITACDGLEAFEKTISKIPDIIVSDIMMPRMNGFELCEQIKKDTRTSHIPIVLLTSISASEKRIQGFEFGADDYLSKPFNAFELEARMKNLLDKRERLHKYYSGKPIANSRLKYSERELKFIEKLTMFVDANLMNENLSVDDLSDEVAMSSSQLNRKLKALINITPNLFIRKHRLNRAKLMIEKREGNISEVCYSVGFSSPAYFTKCFSEEFQVLPSEL